MAIETARPLRFVHYLNQFFAGIGGEEAAGHGVEVRTGAVGPGLALQRILAERGEVVATVICGDNFFAEQPDEALAAVLAAIAAANPDVVVCGPAFNAGRYGLACGAVGRAVVEQLGRPAVSGMHPDNPAVEAYRRFVYIVPTGASAAGMRQALPAMAELACKLAHGEPIGTPEADSYLPRGFRRNAQATEIGARRAVRMLLDKLQDRPYQTEMPLPSFDRVPTAAALPDLASATIAIVTEGGVVPRGNPDRIETHYASHWARYPIAGLDELSSAAYECVHGGFDTTNVGRDPHRLVPLDVLRSLEAEGVVGKLHDYLYVTVGNGTPVARAQSFAREIAAELKAAGVQGVVLPAT